MVLTNPNCSELFVIVKLKKKIAVIVKNIVFTMEYRARR